MNYMISLLFFLFCVVVGCNVNEAVGVITKTLEVLFSHSLQSSKVTGIYQKQPGTYYYHYRFVVVDETRRNGLCLVLPLVSYFGFDFFE